MDGDIRFNVGANTAQFDAGMARVGNVAQTTGAKVKAAFSGLGLLLAGGVALAGLRSLMEGLDRVAKMATRFGTSAESIQRVSVAADLAGTSIDVVAQSMQKASIAASKATIEGGTMAETFERAGISAQEFNKAQLDQKLLMVARAFEAARGNADATNAIIEILGSRAAGQLIPLLSNVQALQTEMANASVATTEAVNAIEKANDRMTRLGNTIKVAFAGGLEMLNNFSERLGSLASGAGAKTILQMEEEQMRANAEARLRTRGELLPDDSFTRPNVTTEYGPLPGSGETVPGPNAEENVRRINAEIKVMRAELEAAKAPSIDLTEELDEQLSKTEQRKQQQLELKKLALEIREAEAAGNQALADDLKEMEALIKASINYEGDLELAARDVNAAYKDRLRLQNEALQKTIAQAEKEIELAETMAFGTDEAKKRAEWIKVYEETLAKTGREDLARRAANAETFEPEGQTRVRTGGGFALAADNFSQGALDRLRASAESDPNALAALLRLQNEQADAMSRAGDLRSSGRFGSAARAELRANQRADSRAAAEMERQASLDIFGSRNLGDAVRNFERDARSAGMTTREAMDRMGIERKSGESTRDAMQRFLQEQSKTEEQRRAEKEQAAGADSKSQAAQVTPATEGTLQRLITEIVQRLPQNALAA